MQNYTSASYFVNNEHTALHYPGTAVYCFNYTARDDAPASWRTADKMMAEQMLLSILNAKGNPNPIATMYEVMAQLPDLWANETEEGEIPNNVTVEL